MLRMRSVGSLRLNLSHLVGLSIREAAALEASVRAQSETLSHSMWILFGLLVFVQLQNFVSCDLTIAREPSTVDP